MNTAEKALAEKILKEANEATTEMRSHILDQYDRLIRAAATRVEMERPRENLYTATGVRVVPDSDGGL